MKKVSAALLVHNGRILIAQRPHADHLAGLWEFPGGKLESGETPELCLKREMQEEFKIEINVGKFYGESIYHYQQGSIQLLAYWAIWKSGQLQALAHDAYKWVFPKQLQEFQFAPADIPFVEQLSSLDNFSQGRGFFMENERLQKQIDFIIEVDKLKHIFRQNILIDGSRHENDAEHSWHLALMAFLLAEHANKDNLDVARVMKMVLIHDLVEIDAGDTFCYDEIGALDKRDRECKAADRLFNLLPQDQAKEFRDLWEEFEAMDTAESQFAATLDRFQPLLLNSHTTGSTTWERHQVTSDKVYERNQHIKDGSQTLWSYANDVIEDCIAQGLLKK